MTLDELKGHRLFKLLTESQRIFLLEYVTNGGDPIEATKKAYPKAETAQAITSMSRKLLKHPEISALLDLWFGEASEDDEMAMIERAMWDILKDGRASANAKVAAGRLLGELKGKLGKGRVKTTDAPQSLEAFMDEIDNS